MLCCLPLFVCVCVCVCVCVRMSNFLEVFGRLSQKRLPSLIFRILNGNVTMIVQEVMPSSNKTLYLTMTFVYLKQGASGSGTRSKIDTTMAHTRSCGPHV